MKIRLVLGLASVLLLQVASIHSNCVAAVEPTPSSSGSCNQSLESAYTISSEYEPEVGLHRVRIMPVGRTLAVGEFTAPTQVRDSAVYTTKGGAVLAGVIGVDNVLHVYVLTNPSKDEIHYSSVVESTETVHDWFQSNGDSFESLPEYTAPPAE